MKQVRLLMAGLFLMISGALFAQEISVSGTVIDASTGEPVPYASIQIKGTTQGATTDDFGKFSMSVDAKGTLIFSSIGYVTLEVPVEGKTQLAITMEPDAVMLEETIVVGYGTAKKISSVVGSASTVRAKALENRPVANVADALQGQVAGMQVFSSSGEPSANQVSMRIRGVNSITAGNTPLIILDGSPVDISIFSTLSSNDIESVVTLKDASSTAIYGSRAANGVIFITTKKGKRGEKARVQIRGQYGISSLINHNIELMDRDQWFQFNSEMDPTFLTPERQAQWDLAKKCGINTNWMDYFFQKNAPVYSVEANISGASEKTDYYISLSQYDETGTAPYSSMARYGIRSNINTKVNDWLKFGVNLAFTMSDSRTNGFAANRENFDFNPVHASNSYLPWVSPYEVLLDDQGNFLGFGEDRQIFTEMGEQKYNLKYLMGIQPSSNKYYRLNGNMYQEITPVKGLTLRAAQALEGYVYRYSYKAIPTGPFSEANGGGSASESYASSYRMTFTNTAEYKFDVASKSHFNFLLGQEAIISEYDSFGASANGTTDPRQDEISFAPLEKQISWGYSKTVFNSYFIRGSYDFDGRYYVDASYRIDGSSLFGANKRYANFYSVGAMWDIKAEKFMSNAHWVNDLRLKLSYGTTGNSSIDNYLAYGTVGAGGYYNGGLAWGLANPENQDLTWEVVENFNVGVTTRLFDRWDLSVDFYHKLTKDMLMSIPYSLTTGHASGMGNIGSMSNTGVDLDTNIDIYRDRNFYFGIRTNFNYNRNEIVELFDGRDEFEVPNTGIKYKVGTSYGELYFPVSAGVDPRDGKQMWYDLNGNKTKVFSDSYSQFTGMQRYAPWAGGVQLNFSWKGLALNADFSWVAGKYVVNNDLFFLMAPKSAAVRNVATELFDIWTTPGQVTDIPAFTEDRQFDTTWIEDASFLRLKNLQLSYTFPEELMRKTKFFESIRVYAIARNLWTLTKYSGYDPEVDTNVQLGNYPNSKQFTFGIELTF